MVQTNYDATSCYDRIIICLAMLVSRKYDVPREITQTNATALEHATYWIRSELGVADDGYQHSAENPIYGTGQGSGNSPMIWCFLLNVLFQMNDELCHKAHYCRPDRTNPMDLGMIGFVDDSNGQTQIPQRYPATILHHQLRQNAEIWADVLGTSGGALELTECSCHLAV